MCKPPRCPLVSRWNWNAHDARPRRATTPVQIWKVCDTKSSLRTVPCHPGLHEWLVPWTAADAGLAAQASALGHFHAPKASRRRWNGPTRGPVHHPLLRGLPCPETSRDDISGKWCNEVVTEFERNIAKRYPFNPTGHDVAVSDFSGFFHPESGELWKFYDTVLKTDVPLRGMKFEPNERGSSSTTTYRGRELSADG
mgnify:CR=1 FL=1